MIKEIEQNQLTRYGNVQRMAEGRLPKIALKWMPKQKRARGRPKKNWMESTGCPTTYQTRHFFNNFKTNEDIATRFEQEYIRCVGNVTTS